MMWIIDRHEYRPIKVEKLDDGSYNTYLWSHWFQKWEFDDNVGQDSFDMLKKDAANVFVLEPK